MIRFVFAGLVFASATLCGGAIASEASLRDSTPDQQPSPMRSSVLRPWMDGPSGNLQGEDVVSQWPVFVPAPDVAKVSAVQIAFDNSISILPDTSVLSVFVNDQLIGTTHLTAGEGQVVKRFKIDPSVLVAGVNALRVTARATHRVDCSAEATYELWTRLDSKLTGIVVTGSDARRANIGGGLQDLLGLTLASDGSSPITIAFPTAPTPKQTERVTRAVQALARDLHLPNPIVRFHPEISGADGLTLVVGRKGDLADAGLEKVRDGVTVDASTGRMTLAITGIDEATVDRAVDSVIDQLDRLTVAGSEAGRRAFTVAGETRIDHDQVLTFGDLGLDLTDFSGRRWERSVHISLPDTFVPSSVNRGFIRLKGSVAGGLLAGSALTARVNGVGAGSLSLVSPDGTSLDGERLELPFQLFHPGVNTLSLEAITNAPTNSTCLSTSSAQQALVRLDAASVISFPDPGHLNSGPELGGRLSGRQLEVPTEPVRVWLLRADAATLGAALTTIANMAAHGNRAPFSIRFGRPTLMSGAGLVFGAISELPPELAAYVRDKTVQGGDPATGEGSATEFDPALSPAGEIYDSATAPTVATGAMTIDVHQPATWFRRARTTLINGLQWMGFDFADPSQSKKAVLHPRSVLFAEVMGAAGTPIAAGTVFNGMSPLPASWVIATARSSDQLESGLQNMVAGGAWGQIDGEMSVYDPNLKQLASLQPLARAFALPANWSWTDLPVLIGMRFSENILVYGVVLIGLMSALNALTMVLVRKKGARQ